jgi:hypothetical protein
VPKTYGKGKAPVLTEDDVDDLAAEMFPEEFV